MTVSLIPISLMVYAITSLYQKPTKPMVADYLSFFAFGCAWVTTALQSGSIIVRLVLLLPLVAFLCVFLVGNKLCVRFFRDWVHHEMLLEWRNGAPIAWDAFSALKAWDWIGGVAGPMLFVAITVGSVPPALPAWSIGAWLALAVVAALMHAKLRQRDFDPEEHNPFMNFLRGWLSELRRMNDQKAESLGEDILPSVATGYSRAGVPSFPLIQEPVGDAPSPRITAPDGGPINVVMIVLESVRAFECGVYGAPTSFSPEFDALAREGMLVRQFYANGSQTARGELSLLCSYYDHFRASPLYLRNPALRLRSLPEILRDRGYKTNWISSHTADYCNKRGFLTRHGVDQIYDDVHLPPGLPKINWGPPDEDLFRSAIGVLDKQTGPFFAEIMSLTNHWPFEGPYPTSDRTPEVTTDKSYRDYTRGVFYTDHALGQFIREAKTKPWFNRTLFVITSDHGAWVFPKDKPMQPLQMQEAYFRMPLLFYAPGMIQPGERNEVLSQVDVAPTILDLLGIRARNAFVGRSLFDACPPEERSALMMHWHTWNLRSGNRYLYNMGRTFTATQHASARPNDRKDRGISSYAYFGHDGDLLRIPDPKAVEILDDREKEAAMSEVEDLLFLTYYLSQRNRVYDQAIASGK